MKRKLLRKRALIPAVAALVVAGGALAAWFVIATGDGGRTKLGELATPTVTNVTPGTGSCFPGQSCSLSVTVNNPNTMPLKLVSVDWTNPNVTVEKPLGTSIAGTCNPATNITVNDPLTGLNVTVPPGSSTVEVPGAFLLAEGAPAACMGAYVTIISNNHQYTFGTS